MGQFYEISIVYPNFFFCISGTGNSLSAGSKNIKKFYRQENFRANVLKEAVPKVSTSVPISLEPIIDFKFKMAAT